MIEINKPNYKFLEDACLIKKLCRIDLFCSDEYGNSIDKNDRIQMLDDLKVGKQKDFF